MINLFSNTFKAPHFDYLVGSSAQHFSGLVAIAERIDKSSNLERLLTQLRRKGFTGKRKETSVHNIKGGYQGERNNYQNKEI